MAGKDEGAVTMLCPMLGCKKTVTAREWMRGKVVRCPHCNTLFRVPASPPNATVAGRRKP